MKLVQIASFTSYLARKRLAISSYLVFTVSQSRPFAILAAMWSINTRVESASSSSVHVNWYPCQLSLPSKLFQRHLVSENELLKLTRPNLF